MNEVKPLTETILKSGLVDKSMARMLEHWGNLPSGAADLVPEDEDHLKKATKAELDSLVENISSEVEKARLLKESQLDLDRLRWPTKVGLRNEQQDVIASQVPAVIDRMNRLYFRMEDIDEKWFVPGFTLSRQVPDKAIPGCVKIVDSIITESTVLYLGDQPVCLQVSSQRVEDPTP